MLSFSHKHDAINVVIHTSDTCTGRVHVEKARGEYKHKHSTRTTRYSTSINYEFGLGKLFALTSLFSINFVMLEKIDNKQAILSMLFN